jgi:hypothetical protein
MTTGNTRVFECFKVGDHTTMAGTAMTWTGRDLEAVCLNYQCRAERAPLVLGHPASNGPAFGEVSELFTRRGRLYAVAKVGQQLLSLVREGRFKHVSAAFERVSGRAGWCLRHIGFLGAVPPAVKGLAPLAFAAFTDMPQPPNSVCFAESSGPGIAPAPLISIPAGWNVTPEGWALYLSARNVQAACPDMSFAEAASLAERYTFVFP